MTKPLALVVEDNEMLASFFTTIFEDAGYVVVAAETGAEAFVYLENHTPLVAMLDLNLPDVSGEGILSYIRSQPRFATTWILAASVEGTRVGYLDRTADFVLTKPVSYHQLFHITERLKTAVRKDLIS